MAARNGCAGHASGGGPAVKAVMPPASFVVVFEVRMRAELEVVYDFVSFRI